MECTKCKKPLLEFRIKTRKYYYSRESAVPFVVETVKKLECPKCRIMYFYQKTKRFKRNTEAPISAQGICPFCKKQIAFLILVEKREFLYKYDYYHPLTYRPDRRYYCPKCLRQIRYYADCVFEYPELIGRVKWTKRTWEQFCSLGLFMVNAIGSRDIQRIVKLLQYEPKEDFIRKIKTLKLFLLPEDYAELLSHLL